MKGSDFLDEMENISPELIEAADNKAAGRKSRVMKYTALAASIFLVVAGASVLFNKPVKPEPVAPVWEGSEKVYDAARWGSKAGEIFRPGSAFSVPEIYFGAHGYEAVKAADPAEIHADNPWNESFGEGYLPVYASRKYDVSGAGYPLGLSELEMREYLGWLCQTLGQRTVCIGEKMEQTPLQKYYAQFYKKGVAVPSKYLVKVMYRLTAYTDKGYMEISANGEARIDIQGKYVSCDITSDDPEDMIYTVAEEYSSLLGFEEPVINIYYQKRWDKNIEEMVDVPLCTVWEGVGDQRSRILDYNLYRLSFMYFDDVLSIVIDNVYLTAEKIGDYPVIDEAAAVERLKAGYYASSYPEAFRGEEYIGKIELVYRHGPLDKLIMPYYRIYLLIDPVNKKDEENRKNGIESYAAYYVPAIADEYVTDMPVYDGKFN